MALVPCKSCGELISDQASTCPKCGAPVDNGSTNPMSDKVDMFITVHGKEFPEDQLPYIREKLLNMNNDRLARLNMLQFKNPTTILLVSIFIGSLGIDRFMIGSTGAGVGKLLTCGGCGIWWLIDLFIICEKTRQHNFQKLISIF